MLTSSPDGIPVLEPRNLVRRRFVMALGMIAIIGLIAILLNQGTNDRVLGSGSTAAQPLIERLSINFQNDRSGDSDWISGSSGIDYEPIGSLGGVMRLQQDSEVDFAITDYPLSAATLRNLGVAQFPVVVGSISTAYNVGTRGAPPLRFSARALTGIFSGRITSWNDPAIAADNPGAHLPATPITVIYRNDGSGSTFNWSSYLARVDTDWKDRIGTGTNLDWPVGVGVKGSREVAEAIAERQGAIGYLETGQARRAGLSLGLVQNDAGEFVGATDASVLAGSRGIGSENTGVTREADAYPVVAASYVVMKRSNASAADNRRALRFFTFLLDHGAGEARTLGYLPLSGNDIADVKEIWVRELGFNAAGEAPAAN